MSNPTYKGLEIVLLCNKGDVYLTKICIASIRYYYPDIPISIVKDEINGAFDTTNLERYFGVSILDLGLKKYGWCTGKIALFLAHHLKGRKFLLLDSDIVFIGKVLDKILPELDDADFIVSPELGVSPDMPWFRRTYYKMEWALNVYPEHTFPGYSFNGGQMVVSPGVFTEEELRAYIDLKSFPYWTPLAKAELPCLDQSLLNVLLPLKDKKGELRLKAIFFQLWSDSEETKSGYDLATIKESGFPFLIHWAGVLRVPHVAKMTRSDIMLFFKSYYFSRIPLGSLRFQVDNVAQAILFYVKRFVKRLIKK